MRSTGGNRASRGCLYCAFMTEPATVDWKGADELWPSIADAYSRMQGLDDSGAASTSLAARQVDRVQPAGHRPYIAAHRLLTIAQENHLAFLGLVRAIGFGPNAPFNLLRPVLENSLWAIWLLDPRRSHDRRRRGLHYEVLDHKAELAFLEELGKLSDGREYREQAAERRATAGASYRRDAEALGVEYAELGRKVNLTDEVPKLDWLVSRHGTDYARIVVAEWRRLSGYQHTKVWASMFGSDRTFVARIDGGGVAHFVASDDGISLAVGTSGLVLLEAMRLYERRHNGPA